MISCWRPTPDARPTFDVIHRELARIAEMVVLETSPNVSCSMLLMKYSLNYDIGVRRFNSAAIDSKAPPEGTSTLPTRQADRDCAYHTRWARVDTP